MLNGSWELDYERTKFHSLIKLPQTALLEKFLLSTSVTVTIRKSRMLNVNSRFAMIFLSRPLKDGKI